MRLGEGGESHHEIASLVASLPFRRHELQRVVLFGDDPWWAEFSDALA